MSIQVCIKKLKYLKIIYNYVSYKVAHHVGKQPLKDETDEQVVIYH